MEFVNQALEYMKSGFGAVNGDATALVIALIAAIIMSSWKQWIPFVVIAVVVHLIVRKVQASEFNLPNIMEQEFWVSTGVLALGYLIIIGVLFFLKSLVIKPAAAKAH
ncbi:hypothetical protein [Terricaulis sp.]|uniref:hypothetical protein n=1 Tax=Terricaulis sp. TaxID=2768686 RepID=UPI003784F50A